MNQIKKAIGFILVTIGVIGFMMPFVFWVQDSELSQMEVTLNYWHYFVSGIVLILIGGVMAEIDNLI